MRLYKNLKPLLLATLMLLMTQAGSLYGFNDSMNDQNPVLNELEEQFFVGGPSLSPAYTNVTLINNTAMTPITFNWLGSSGVSNGTTTPIHASGGTGWNAYFYHVDAAIDSNDNIHISYFDTSTDGLIYATDKSGIWSHQSLDNGSTSPNQETGKFTSIAVDSNDNVHISYTNLSSKDIMYATDSSGSWSTSAIASMNTVWSHSRCTTAIAIDSNDAVHVTHSVNCGNTASKLAYTTNVNGTWVTTILETDSYPDILEGWKDIAIDSNDKVHIAYSNRAGLNHTTNQNNTWQVETIPGTTWNQAHPQHISMAIDSNDYLHIAFTKATGYHRLNYVHNIGGSWSSSPNSPNFTTCGNNGALSCGQHTSIAIDSNDVVHITDQMVSWSQLRYHTNASGTWVATTYSHGNASAGNGNGYETAIVLDSNDDAHIIHSNMTNYVHSIVETTHQGYGNTGSGSSGSSGIYNGNNTVWLASDINPTGNGKPYWMTVLGTRLYFSGDTGGGNGTELIAYDPANSTSWMVADINPSGNSEPRHLFALGTRLYFTADDGTNGRELWAYEETNDTAWMVADIDPSGDGDLIYIVTIGTRVYFTGDDGTNGRELWAYEETNDTAWMVNDTYSGPGNGNYGHLVALGTRVYFTGDDGTNGRELWAYEETNDTAWMVADIHPTTHSSPTNFVTLGSRLYFSANDGTNGDELWAYEETNDTAWMVADIRSTGGNSNPSGIIASGSRLYFTAFDGTNWYELWTYEETNDTAWMITDAGEGHYDIQIGALGTRIFFNYGNPTWANRWDLWSYEATNDTAWRIGNVNQVTAYTSEMTVLDNRVYFRANDGTNGNELWAYDPAGMAVSGPNNGSISNAICEISPSLPTGLTLTQGTCTISGTPTVVQNGTTYTLWANESGYSDWATVVISVISGDSDGDGYPDIIDAFPNDPTEWIDTDGDGIGNNADPDDDNDSYNDTIEIDCLSDPLDNVSVPLDNDLDGICDELDPDDDNDGLEDVNETASLPATDPFLPDTDGDGVCDGPVAINGTCTAGPDAFPTDPSEWLDTDGDGIGNNADTDDDGDGLDDVNETASLPATDPLLPDTDGDGYCDGPIAVDLICLAGPDAFPTDPSEWLDTDGDGIGNNADTDDDGDGLDDVNENASLPPTDPQLADTDGDGVCDGPIAVDPICLAGPDAFPTDPSEWVDTDGDGIGNNADTDDDNDGLDDVNETSSVPPTDPLLVDTDGDGVCDGSIAVDPICLAGPDAFPTDPSEWVDTDGDGIGDNADDDDDGDGRTDGNDTFPLDPTEWIDMDGDGIGDNSDPDVDGDGLNNTDESTIGTSPLLPDTDGDGVCDGPNSVLPACVAGPDAFPLDANESVDTDGDGIGNNADDDDDGDGYSDQMEADCLSDSLDSASTPPDNDADFICDDVDPDDDNDLASDIDEIAAGTDPFDPDDFPTDDADQDGWTDAQERSCNTDENNATSVPVDTDGDRYCDFVSNDDDGDGWTDSDEDACGTDSLDSDSIPEDADENGICDALEPTTEVEGEGDEDIDQNTDNLSSFSMWSCCILLLILLLIFALVARRRDEEEQENLSLVLSIDESFDEDDGVEEPLETPKSEAVEYDEIYGSDDAAISEKQAELADLDAQLEAKTAEIEALENASNVDFGTIGVATASDKDDLTAIKGIGPVLQGKLNDAGIFTLKQLSKVTPEIEGQIDEAIGSFPGRLSRADVFNQARVLVK